jgi:hypothetical protein
LSIFVFVACAFEVRYIKKKILAQAKGLKHFPMLSSSSFTVSGLSFKFLIYFELIIVTKK